MFNTTPSEKWAIFYVPEVKKKKFCSIPVKEVNRIFSIYSKIVLSTAVNHCDKLVTGKLLQKLTLSILNKTVAISRPKIGTWMNMVMLLMSSCIVIILVKFRECRRWGQCHDEVICMKIRSWLLSFISNLYNSSWIYHFISNLSFILNLSVILNISNVNRQDLLVQLCMKPNKLHQLPLRRSAFRRTIA